MNPQLQSFLTSFGIFVATSLASWAVSVGIVPASDQSNFVNELVAGGGYVAAAALTWYKTRSHTPTAQIVAVNAANNGVKVVAAAASAPQVDAPLKGVGK